MKYTSCIFHTWECNSFLPTVYYKLNTRFVIVHFCSQDSVQNVHTKPILATCPCDADYRKNSSVVELVPGRHRRNSTNFSTFNARIWILLKWENISIHCWGGRVFFSYRLLHIHILFLHMIFWKLKWWHIYSYKT